LFHTLVAGKIGQFGAAGRSGVDAAPTGVDAINATTSAPTTERLIRDISMIGFSPVATVPICAV